ncbi:hypothetical protein MHYP_G00129750 [Metynnis hypsauchen]
MTVPFSQQLTVRFELDPTSGHTLAVALVSVCVRARVLTLVNDIDPRDSSMSAASSRRSAVLGRFEPLCCNENPFTVRFSLSVSKSAEGLSSLSVSTQSRRLHLLLLIISDHVCRMTEPVLSD